jgi:hypothetical protein
MGSGIRTLNSAHRQSQAGCGRYHARRGSQLHHSLPTLLIRPLSAKRLVSGLRRPPQPLPIPSLLSPETHRSLTVVPLLSLQRYDGETMVRLRRGDGGECVAGLPWRLEIAEMRRVKAGKDSRRSEVHEPGNGPKEQNSTFPLEGSHSTDQPAKARTVSTDSNGNATHPIARHVTARDKEFVRPWNRAFPSQKWQLALDSSPSPPSRQDLRPLVWQAWG